MTVQLGRFAGIEVSRQLVDKRAYLRFADHVHIRDLRLASMRAEIPLFLYLRHQIPEGRMEESGRLQRAESSQPARTYVVEVSQLVSGGKNYVAD
jgi:hypothetical protein